jgi:hypothetical protein
MHVMRICTYAAYFNLITDLSCAQDLTSFSNENVTKYFSFFKRSPQSRKN